MTVHIAHAPDDVDAAAALEHFLERRGIFTEREAGPAFSPFRRSDVAVVVWSQNAMQGDGRLLLERRALDAWSEGRLVLVKLDHSALPVGLRDLSAIEATFEPQRDIAWAAVVKSIQDAMESARQVGADEALDDFGDMATPPAAPAPQADAPSRAAKRATAGLWRWVTTGVVVLGGALGAAALLAGVSATLWLIVAGVIGLAALAALLAASMIAAHDRQAAQSRAEASERAGAPGAHEPLFVSYARANQAEVTPLVASLKSAGRPVWMDTADIAAGVGWAGEIVRAIKGCDRVVVMCSQAAFESDHVKREVYLADRYKRRLTPVFLEAAAPPEDFEYFFAGVQALELYALSGEARADALADALANG